MRATIKRSLQNSVSSISIIDYDDAVARVIRSKGGFIWACKKL